MSNLREVKPKVKTITLTDGVEREIRYTLNAMAEMEDKFGSVQAAFEALDKGSMKAIRFILWAGLMHNEEDPLTEQQVGNLIDINYLTKLNEAMADALSDDALVGDDQATVAEVTGPNA